VIRALVAGLGLALAASTAAPAAAQDGGIGIVQGKCLATDARPNEGTTVWIIGLAGGPGTVTEAVITNQLSIYDDERFDCPMMNEGRGVTFNGNPGAYYIIRNGPEPDLAFATIGKGFKSEMVDRNLVLTAPNGMMVNLTSCATADAMNFAARVVDPSYAIKPPIWEAVYTVDYDLVPDCPETKPAP
jgi:hypothetical protein